MFITRYFEPNVQIINSIVSWSCCKFVAPPWHIWYTTIKMCPDRCLACGLTARRSLFRVRSSAPAVHVNRNWPANHANYSLPHLLHRVTSLNNNLHSSFSTVKFLVISLDLYRSPSKNDIYFSRKHMAEETTTIHLKWCRALPSLFFIGKQAIGSIRHMAIQKSLFSYAVGFRHNNLRQKYGDK